MKFAGFLFTYQNIQSVTIKRNATISVVLYNEKRGVTYVYIIYRY